MKIKTTAAGQNANQTIDLKLDQKAKTVELKSEFTKTQLLIKFLGMYLFLKMWMNPPQVIRKSLKIT